MIPEESILKIIKYAAKAPSGHNTQPWKFKIGNDTISLLPDFTRTLPIVDSDNHALYISLGCALENLIIAANEFNYETKIEINSKDSGLSIRVNLFKGMETKKPELFNYIVKRQVTRSKYKPNKIPYKVLSQLFNDSHEKGVYLKLFLSETEIKSLMPYIIEGNALQFNNKVFVNELVSWLRFSEKEVMLKGDGLWSASMGLPNTGRFIGNVVMKKFVSAGSEARRLEKLIQATAGLALFMVEKNEPYYWIKLGQSFQRFGLKAAKYNISHAHVNMPCEELEVREKLIHDFQLKDLTPLLLIRFGFSDPMPYSFRRNISNLILR